MEWQGQATGGASHGAAGVTVRLGGDSVVTILETGPSLHTVAQPLSISLQFLQHTLRLAEKVQKIRITANNRKVVVDKTQISTGKPEKGMFWQLWRWHFN